jgi:Zn-dependent protease
MALNKDKSNKKTIMGSLGILGVILLKGKTYLFAAWKALALFKMGWIISPLLTIGVYTMLFGLPYAIAVFILLLTHEMGHWIWMKALGLEPKLPVFIPGIGAYVAMTKLPADQATHAWVALAGPLIGGLTSGTLFWFGVVYSNTWLMAAGSTGFFLNLFQLVPAKPFDGGFIIQAVYKWLLIPGTVMLFVLTYFFHSILLLIISVISLVSLFGQLSRERAIRAEQKTLDDSYGYAVEKSSSGPFDTSQKAANSIPGLSQTDSLLTPKPLNTVSTLFNQKPATLEQRILIAVAYFSLAGMLAYLYWLSNNELIVFMPHHK